MPNSNILMYTTEDGLTKIEQKNRYAIPFLYEVGRG